MSSSNDRYLDELAERHGRLPTCTFIPEPEPEPLFCPIVSVDDHALEPFDLFADRVPTAMVGAAPSVRMADDGAPRWVIDDAEVAINLNNAACGRVREEWKGKARIGLDEMRASVHDPRRRLADMDLVGVWASLCFPSTVFGFAGWRFSKMRDPQVGLASLRAWNDWMLDEWCATDPARYIPCQLPWMADGEVAADEIRANAERGFHAVSFAENPEGLGFPTIYDPSWDPFFAACAETGTVVNLHVGSSGSTVVPSSVSPTEAYAALFPVSGIQTVVDWIFAKIPVRHPDLQIVLSESGVSWVPMVMERLQRAHRYVASSDVWTVDDPHPVDLLHRNFLFTSIEDPSAFHALDLVGADAVMVETDFPHLDSTWPTSQAMIRSELAHLPAATVRKVCFENACRVYQHPLPPDDLIARSEVGAAATAAVG